MTPVEEESAVEPGAGAGAGVDGVEGAGAGAGVGAARVVGARCVRRAFS